MAKRTVLVSFPVVLLSLTSVLARGSWQLAILSPNYPRVFYFRATEAACSAIRYPTYESWERNFDGLMGIMGKCLEEECMGREPRNPEFFTRFKQRHPEQAVLLHFNGNSRDPIYQTDGFFPGHWIYRKAVMITEDVLATPGESVLKVADARFFKVDTGRYREHNDDIALFGMKDGLHDWYHCEHVQLISVDHEANTIVVQRGCYGSKPLAFKANESRAAAHAVEGPWGANNHFLWYYNYSTHCPKDRNGKVCSDILVDDLARWFGKEGTLGALDGLEFDVLFNVTDGDTDGDGEVDNGVIDSRNNYGIGVVEFGQKLRARMGEDFIIQADGALGRGGARSQRNWGIFNGIESEGWPNLHEWEINDWSGGLNRHFFWQENARKPVFNYINHKWVEAVPDRPGIHRRVRVPFSRHRLVFAAAQFFDAMICYSSPPVLPVSTGYTYWYRDVVVPADASLVFHIGMGVKSPERSDGVWFKVYAAEISAGKPEGYTQLFEESSKEYTWLPQSISLRKYAGKRVRLKFVADCGPADDATTDHASWGDVKIKAPGGVESLVSAALPATGMCLRHGEEKAIDTQTGARVTYEESLEVAGVALPAYFVHPPYRKQGRFDKFPIWDEFIRGEDNLLGWLGSPEAPAIHLAAETPDLLEASGHGSALAKQIRGSVATSVEDGSVVVRPQDPTAKDLTFVIRDIPANGEDLYVSVRMKGAPMAGYPREMARYAEVAAAGGIIDLMGGSRRDAGMCLRGREEEAIDKSTGARVTKGTAEIGGKKLPTFFVHPPWRKGTGYTYWSKEVDVPVDTELRFCVGMGEKSPERSDGVWFQVHAAIVEDSGVGQYVKISETSSKAHEWLPQTVSLQDYADKRVRLKFVADAGPDDDSTTDHAHWGDIKILKAGVKESELTKAVEYMTWVNDKPFTSSFYFRHIKTEKVDLSFTIESSEPVAIESITTHAHPDAMYRVFQKGLVLANPSRNPYTFDLKAITPGRKYRRLQATKHQDSMANTGQPVGNTVTLGERDALFLVRTE